MCLRLSASVAANTAESDKIRSPSGWIHGEESGIDILPSIRGYTVFAWVKNVGRHPVNRIAITVQGDQPYEKTLLIDEGLLPGQKKRLEFKVPTSCLTTPSRGTKWRSVSSAASSSSAKQPTTATDEKSANKSAFHTPWIWVSRVDDRKIPAPGNPPADNSTLPDAADRPQLDEAALQQKRSFERLPDAVIVAFESGDRAIVDMQGQRFRIRLAGVAAPTDIAGGKAALETFRSLALGRPLKVQFVGKRETTRWAVLYHKTVNLNERLIRAGAARYAAATYESGPLKEAEKAAQRARVGLWQSVPPLP